MVSCSYSTKAGGSLPAETHVEQNPPDRDGVFGIIRDQLSDILEIEPDRVTESSSFVEDLEGNVLYIDLELLSPLCAYSARVNSTQVLPMPLKPLPNLLLLTFSMTEIVA